MERDCLLLDAQPHPRLDQDASNPPDPNLERLRDWVYGGEDFLKRMLAMASGEDEGANRRRRRRMDPVTVDAILDATALRYGTSADTYCGYRSSPGGRNVAALLCRRWTTATLRELSGRFGLSHPDSASDLIKRGKRLAESNRDVARKVASIEKDLGLNPESRD